MKTICSPELDFNLVNNKVFPSGIPVPAGNRDASKSRKSRKPRKNSAFQSRLYRKIAAALKKKDYFESSLKQVIFASGLETALSGPQRPTSALPFTPCPAPTPCKKPCGSGNRCGHDPKNPQLLDIPIPENRPKFIQEAARTLRSHVEKTGLLPVLNFHADGRKVRSERRDGIGMLLVALVLRMDLATGRVGFPTENGFFNYTMDHLATWAGLGERRAARIVATLKDAGYLAVSQIRERLKDGSYRSFSAIKIVSTTLFDALGLRGWLDKERAKARERLRIKQKAYEKACAKIGVTMMKQLTAKIAGMDQTSHTRNADEKAPDKAAKNWPTSIIDATTGTRSLDPMTKYLAQLNPEAKALLSKLALAILTQHPDRWVLSPPGLEGRAVSSHRIQPSMRLVGSLAKALRLDVRIVDLHPTVSRYLTQTCNNLV